MTKRGRPARPTKEGLHRHPGSMRWHLYAKNHHLPLHVNYKDQIQVTAPVIKETAAREEVPPQVDEVYIDPNLAKAMELFSQDGEILTLIKDIEEGIATGEVLGTIGEIIKTLLLEEDKDTPQDTDFPYSHKEEPYGEPNNEEREPNTIGLP